MIEMLIENENIEIECFKNQYSLLVSKSFLHCANCQLSSLFLLQTGIMPQKNVRLNVVPHSLEKPVYGTYLIPNTNYVGNKLSITIYVSHKWNPVTIYWKSRTSPRQYALHDEVDCNDIEFWFESLDPLLYHQQLYPNVKLPFKLKDLSYELVVNRLNMDMVIEMSLTESAVENAAIILDSIDNMLNDFNEKSMKNDRKDGVVHNWKRKVDRNKLVYEIDTGSAGAPFLKKLLLFLSKINKFVKVEVS